jgi:hypothetical protein
LRRLNRRAAIIIEGDRSAALKPLNGTKMRLIEEFDQGPGHAWVTAGREIENYLQPDHVHQAILAVAPNARPASRGMRYARMLATEGGSGRRDISKVEIAQSLAMREKLRSQGGRYDLADRVPRIVSFIR